MAITVILYHHYKRFYYSFVQRMNILYIGKVALLSDTLIEKY